MKQIGVFLFLCLMLVSVVDAQPTTTSTGKLDSLKDGWGEYFNYTGEIKNKLPNGLGVAHYNGDYVLWYGGYFLNGKFEGKGALVFKDGFFLSGNWKAGKLNGDGTNLTKDGDIYVGNFKDGSKNGQGIYVFKDNSILSGSFSADKYDGRCIFINAPGDIISDNIYAADKKNGNGYQYEVKDDKLYKGVWKDGDWQNANDGTYKSFLLNPNFTGEKTENYILMGSFDKSNNNLLTDTCFYYDLKKSKKYFGIYNAGFLTSGLTVKKDSTVFVGKLSKEGAQGVCQFYKAGKYYDEGTYVDDFLSGANCMSIDLEKKTLYFGEMKNKGEFSGKAWFVSKGGTLYNGSYLLGSFTGIGTKTTIDGLCIKGSWDDGLLTTLESLTDNKGQKLNIKPTNMTDVISLMSRFDENDLDALIGEEENDWTNDLAYYVYDSYIQLPNTEKTYIVEDNDYYLSAYTILKSTDDYEAAKAIYSTVCADIKKAKPIVESGSSAVTMVGDIQGAGSDDETTVSLFKPSKQSKKYSDFSVAVRLSKDADDKYEVALVFGSDISLFTD